MEIKCLVISLAVLGLSSCLGKSNKLAKVQDLLICTTIFSKHGEFFKITVSLEFDKKSLFVSSDK